MPDPKFLKPWHGIPREQIDLRDRYLWNKRIEIDAILAQVGGEGLQKYLMHQITTISPIRDYTQIIEQLLFSHLIYLATTLFLTIHYWSGFYAPTVV